jgi:RNAse (barnase) inhibitor barstar
LPPSEGVAFASEKGSDLDAIWHLVRVSQRSYMVAIARILLREMTESDIGTTPVE